MQHANTPQANSHDSKAAKNLQAMQANWGDIRQKLKTRFAKLTDESIESVKDNLETLSGKLQSAYGYAKDHADNEVAGFKSSIASLLSADTNRLNSESPKSEAPKTESTPTQSSSPASSNQPPKTHTN